MQRMDKFGKDVFLNAAWRDFQKISSGKKGKKALAKFTDNHSELFGQDFTKKLLDDLEAGVRSYETDAALFHEITRFQPLTKSEMPQFYLDNPNARIFYMLKSFALKQVDQLRREGLDELLDATDTFRSGDTAGAAKQASTAMMKIGLVVAGTAGFEAVTSDLMKDILRGKPINAETVSDATFANMQRFLFMNPHIVKRFGEGGTGGVATFGASMFPPIVSMIDQGIHDAMLLADGDLTLANSSMTYWAPFIGDGVWWASEAGQKRIKQIELDAAKGKSELFMNIVDAQKTSSRNKKNLKEMVDGDIIHIEDLIGDANKADYLQQLKINDPVRWMKTRKKLRENTVNERLGLSEVEIAFKRKSADVRAVQIAKVINGMSSRAEKQRYYQMMIKKRIITRSVKRLLDPKIKGL